MAKRKKQGAEQKARAIIKGLTIRWHDKNPLREDALVVDPVVGHRNPVYRLAAPRILVDAGEWVIHKAAFRWKVTLTLYFDYPNGRTQKEIRELEAVTAVERLNDHCLEQIKDAMRYGNMDHYRYTEFEIECLGNQ